ncbi:MAG: leucine-rich repeat domain-containing protein [Cytophagales bacterium]|nr:leucine-rich repeat domain-containing protein [Cytophagales bacterium]
MNKLLMFLCMSMTIWSCSTSSQKNDIPTIDDLNQTDKKALLALMEKYKLTNGRVRKGRDYSKEYYIEKGLIGGEIYLEMITITDTDISSLPKEIYAFKNLRRLYLENNQFTDMPEGLSRFKHLRSVHMSGNPIKKINNTLLPNSMMGVFLSETPLESFPHFTRKDNSGYFQLVLRDTKVDSIPDFVGEMNIASLWMQRCPITYISPNLGQCVNMNDMKFEANPFLKEFPETLANMKKMEHIEFNWLPLRKIPDFVWEWKELDALHLKGCLIQEIPPQIGELKKLRYLRVPGNKLSTLPAELGELPIIDYIGAEGNPLHPRSLPKGFFPDRQKPTDSLPSLYVGAPDRYDIFSVPEEQVRKAYRVL